MQDNSSPSKYRPKNIGIHSNSHFLAGSKSKYAWIAGALTLIVLIAALLGWYFVMASPAANVTTKPAAEKTPATQPAAPLAPAADTSSLEATAGIGSMSDTNAQVNINGENIQLPSGGSVHRTIQNDAGNATVDISVDSTTSGSTQSHSSTNIQLNVSSESEVSSGTE